MGILFTMKDNLWTAELKRNNECAGIVFATGQNKTQLSIRDFNRLMGDNKYSNYHGRSFWPVPMCGDSPYYVPTSLDDIMIGGQHYVKFPFFVRLLSTEPHSYFGTDLIQSFTWNCEQNGPLVLDNSLEDPGLFISFNESHNLTLFVPRDVLIGEEICHDALLDILCEYPSLSSTLHALCRDWHYEKDVFRSVLGGVIHDFDITSIPQIEDSSTCMKVIRRFTEAAQEFVHLVGGCYGIN